MLCIIIFQPRYIQHILLSATKFTESHLPPETESALNCIKACVASNTSAQDATKADIIELNVRLQEEKDGRENTEYVLCSAIILIVCNQATDKKWHLISTSIDFIVRIILKLWGYLYPELSEGHSASSLV